MSVLPTIHDRQSVFDISRGMAVLGIFLANLASFCYPMAEMFSNTQRTPFFSYFEAVGLLLVNGKFRTMLAILFGVGLYHQFKKRGHDSALWPGGYLKRSLFLLLIGGSHMLFVWWGDILALYATTAFIVALMVTMKDEVIIKVLWAGILVSSMCAICGGMGLAIMAQGDGQFGESTASMVTREVGIYQSGTYLQQLTHRLTDVVAFAGIQNAAMIPVTVPLFLLGVLLARRGVLVAPSQFPTERKWMLWLGFGVGLPLNIIAAGLSLGEHGMAAMMFVEFLSGPLQGIGYLIVLAMLVEKFRDAKIWNPVKNVGRVALTTYLSQSLIATFLFYSWGMGWFYTEDPVKLLGAIGIVWTFNLVFAWLWLKWFDIGPVELVLRSLTEGKRLPWRYRNTSG
jgi:uncharacterized protein